MTPRDRSIRRSFESNGFLNTGLTATAARQRRAIILDVQWRGSRARFLARRPGEARAVGFTYFGAYCPARGWFLSRRFLSRDELRCAARETMRRKHVAAERAARLRAEADALEAVA